MVRRTFGEVGAEWFLAAHRSGLLQDLVERRLLHPYEVADLDGRVVAISKEVPVATYPYEWSFNMLRDAAMLTLEVIQISWQAGYHLRDASAFNVLATDEGLRFIDLGSFRPGHTPFWFGFGQFCDHFLNPLVLAHLSGTEARWAWQRSLEGLPAGDLRRLLRRRLLRRGLFSHIWLRAALENRNSSLDEKQRTGLRTQTGLPPAVIATRFDRLAGLLGRLDAPNERGWSGYTTECSYSEDESEVKKDFVETAARRWAGDLAVDVGANTGIYSEILSRSFQTVVAIEGDESALDALYVRQTDGALPGNVRPVLADILDPSGGRGLLGFEHPSLLHRLKSADLVVWLAVLHHLVISSNLPLTLFADLAKAMGPHHVVEFVSSDDSMARLLAAGRSEPGWPLDRATFEMEMGRHFETIDQAEISETRRIYAFARR